MKRLIKRYVLKAQVDRENDEVNEGMGGPKEILLKVLEVRGSSLVLLGGDWCGLDSVFFLENAWLFSASRCISVSWGDQGLQFLTQQLLAHPKPKPQVSALDLPLSIYTPLVTSFPVSIISTQPFYLPPL